MADLKEVEKWEEGIYQLETTDPVMGGPDGIDNKQANQLANRTAYLKKQIETVNENIPEVPVQSVNKKTGAVEITANDINALTKETASELFLPASCKLSEDGTKISDKNNTLLYEVDNLLNLLQLVSFKKTPKIDDTELVYLIESYRSGYSWYEKYSNGVVRQGGRAQMQQASNQTVVHTTVNLLVPVLDGDYCVNLTSANSSGNWGNTLHTFSAQSTSSFIISSFCQVVNTQVSQIYWETRGVFK